MTVVADLALAACVILAGLWSGLLLMLTTILHPVLRNMDGPDFAEFLQRFLPVAQHSPTNYSVIIGLLVAPAVALVALGPSDEPAFVLTAVGFGACIAGPLLTSRLLAEPNYRTILGWSDTGVRTTWQTVRRRYFLLNWVRAVATWTALALFGVAAYSHWT